MDITQSSVFLAGSILTILGFVVIVAGAIVINNLLHRFWKPVRIFTVDSFTLFGHHNNPQFMTDEEYAKLTKNLEESKSKDKEKESSLTK